MKIFLCFLAAFMLLTIISCDDIIDADPNINKNLMPGQDTTTTDPPEEPEDSTETDPPDEPKDTTYRNTEFLRIATIREEKEQVFQPGDTLYFKTESTHDYHLFKSITFFNSSEDSTVILEKLGFTEGHAHVVLNDTFTNEDIVIDPELPFVLEPAGEIARYNFLWDKSNLKTIEVTDRLIVNDEIEFIVIFEYLR